MVLGDGVVGHHRKPGCSHNGDQDQKEEMGRG